MWSDSRKDTEDGKWELAFESRTEMEKAKKLLEDHMRREHLKRAYDAGFRAGLSAFAWWRDGVQYVGTSGTTLEEAHNGRKELFSYMATRSAIDVMMQADEEIDEYVREELEAKKT